MVPLNLELLLDRLEVFFDLFFQESRRSGNSVVMSAIRYLTEVLPSVKKHIPPNKSHYFDNPSPPILLRQRTKYVKGERRDKKGNLMSIRQCMTLHLKTLEGFSRCLGPWLSFGLGILIQVSQRGWLEEWEDRARARTRSTCTGQEVE